MKNLIKLALAFTISLLPVQAQQGEGYGFLNIANLIPGDSPCHIRIGGKVLKPDGMKSGSFTGWFMVKNGAKELEVSWGELGEESGNIEITEGQGNVIAVYLEPSEGRDSDGDPKPPQLRIRSFPIYETRGFGLKFVSLYPEIARFQLGSLKVEAKPFDTIDVPGWNGGGFEILANGEVSGEVYGSSEAGAFYLFVGTDQEGAKASVLLSANKQEVPEYFRKDKAAPDESATATKTSNANDSQP